MLIINRGYKKKEANTLMSTRFDKEIKKSFIVILIPLDGTKVFFSWWWSSISKERRRRKRK